MSISELLLPEFDAEMKTTRTTSGTRSLRQNWFRAARKIDAAGKAGTARRRAGGIWINHSDHAGVGFWHGAEPSASAV